jgi:hypothetical protein
VHNIGLTEAVTLINLKDNNIITYVLIGLVAYFALFANKTETPVQQPVQNDNSVAADGSCNYAPTFKLRAQDRWDSTTTLSSGHRYQINGGESQTYAGTAVSRNKQATIDVLWGYGNSTSVIQEKDQYIIDACGQVDLPLNSPKMLQKNTTVTITCFDENNDVINDVANNYTVGTGGNLKSACRLSLDTTKTGFRHGFVLVGELNATAYKEDDVSVTGSIIGGKASIPGSFTLSNAANKAFAYKVSAIEGDVGFKDFTVNVQAETTADPAESTGDIILYLYSVNCYEDSDTHKYECGVNTEDNALTGFQAGTETISVD